jgi:hypothetical protein
MRQQVARFDDQLQAVVADISALSQVQLLQRSLLRQAQQAGRCQLITLCKIQNTEGELRVRTARVKVAKCHTYRNFRHERSKATNASSIVLFTYERYSRSICVNTAKQPTASEVINAHIDRSK